MEITITINGKPVQATVDDAVIREAMTEKKNAKKTGFERNEGAAYCYITTSGVVDADVDANATTDDARYKTGNYYTSRKIAENNARADRLMRNLRRFAGEHGGCVSPARLIEDCSGYAIFKIDAEIHACVAPRYAAFGQILFPSSEAALAAIKAFRDELIWYFTEYDPMPEGWWDE